MTFRPAFPKPKDMPRRKNVEHVVTMQDGREVCDLRSRAGMAEYKLRTLKMWQRQNQRCPACGKLIPWEKASFDHEVPRGHGGGFRDDRIEIRVAVAWNDDGNVTEVVTVWQNQCLHLWCNIKKGSSREVVRLRQTQIFTDAITVDRNLQSPETPDSDRPYEGNDEEDALEYSAADSLGGDDADSDQRLQAGDGSADAGGDPVLLAGGAGTE